MNSYQSLTIDMNITSPLHNIQLVEEVDTQLLSKLISSTLLQTVSWETSAFVFENEKEQLLKILKKVKNNKLIVTYKQAAYKVGRVFAEKGIGLNAVRRAIRHTLCFGKYVDIDIENCHPTILYQICQLSNIPCPYLDEYVHNRNTHLVDIMKHYECTRDEAKKLFIIIMYYGAFHNWTGNLKRKAPTPFLSSFINEIKMLGVLIANANPDIVEIVKKNEKKNDIGTTVSLFLQDKERQILEVMYQFFKTKFNIGNNCVLCFDGIMVLKEHFGPTVLRELKEYIKEVTGFQLNFTTKAFDEHYLDELQDNLDENSFAYMVNEFEKTHCKVLEQGIYVKHSDNKIQLLSKTMLENMYEHLSFTNDKGKEESFIRAWIKNNNNIRHYKSMGFYPPPLQCPEDTINLWIPFAYENNTTPYETHSEGLAFMLNHIKVLCNHEDKVYNYFCKWIGQMLKFPAIKTVCPTLISEEGAGKGSLLDLLRKIMGKNKVFETTNPERDVWGNFNAQMTDCFLVNLNELKKKSTCEFMGIIKGLITDNSLTINPKGVNQYTIDSYHRFLITTNKNDPIPTHARDRRNLIIRSSDELSGKKEYFTKFRELLNNENVIRTCYDYFVNLPGLDTFHQLPLPKTKYQNELRFMNLSPVELFLVNMCETSQPTDKIELLSKEVFDRFQAWVSENNIEYTTTSQKLAVNLNLLNLKGITKGKHTNAGNTKVFDIGLLRKHFQLDDDQFVDEPSLEEVSMNRITTVETKTTTTKTITKKSKPSLIVSLDD